MSRASNGIYTLPNTVNPVVPGTTIEADWANTTLDDLATAVTDSLDRNGRGSMNAAFKLTQGTVALPSLTFSAETSSGLYRVGAGLIGMAVGGASVMTWSAAEVEVLTALQVNGLLTVTGDLAVGGTVSADPAVAADELTTLDQVQDIFLEGQSVPYNTTTFTQAEIFGATADFTLATGNPAGSIAGIINNSAAQISILQGSGLTLRLAGTTSTGGRTLAPRGWATVYAISTTEYYIIGAGLG